MTNPPLESPGAVQEDPEVISDDDLGAARFGRVGRIEPRWLIAFGVLAVIALFGGLILYAVLDGTVTTDQAASLSGTLVFPLVALLGTVVAFSFR